SDPGAHSQGAPASSARRLSLADVLASLERDRRAEPARTERWTGAIRTICNVLGQPASAVPAELPEIDRRLSQIPRRAHGRSTKTIANVRSHLKAAILHVDRGQGPPPRGTPLSPEWARLSDALVDRRLKHGLTRLMRIASWQGISPAEMNDAV